MLADPRSPYSTTRTHPDFTNDAEWPEVLARLPGNLSTENAVAVLGWDLGLTRARPGQDIVPREGFRDSFVAASATKADVDADIFWHMVDLTGFRHFTKAATYAVAMQILRRQILETDPARHASLGIDKDVFLRVMRAAYLDQVPTYDMQYLTTLVQHRLIHWQVGDRATTGSRALPAAFRVARIAAAYRDAQGYLIGYPCNSDATPRAGTAGSGVEGDERPLCFVAATDRAIHRWYVDESDRQARWVPERELDGVQRLAGFVAAVFVLLDLAPFVEMIEAVAADDLVTARLVTRAEADLAAERADSLFCPLPE
ncbi:hypothetical protein BJI69_05080 [Luteibacter rhizovicinus DSM 16549]|uniref:Uncharacterized protein n=1 Tax=Luteibacter rhizovicinus DSM 16549 TaxID=1440763 RepID=A0A0G9HF31_9GAMM|nr:hypothetical protein BJI69_05080 [Luteibacter rhizovicinus DSM 16549]KLD67779.1 hypothetical protein Y883_06350 [Luteibacter rhizovicinus DSM 16549]KLD79387.1 hypothetical protein Y886_04690 [Xanthomonas hyacinthi DSM 19077]